MTNNLAYLAAGNQRAAFAGGSVRAVGFRAALLTGVATATLLAGASGAVADTFTWSGPISPTLAWEQLQYWTDDGATADRLPGSGDTVIFPDTYVSRGTTINFVISTDPTIDTLNLEGGTLSVQQGNELDVETLNIGANGNLYLAKPPKDSPLAVGTVNVSGAVNLSGGSIDRNGDVEVGPDGIFNQAGGNVFRNVTIDAPTYVQSAGDLGPPVIVTSDDTSYRAVRWKAPSIRQLRAVQRHRLRHWHGDGRCLRAVGRGLDRRGQHGDLKPRRDAGQRDGRHQRFR